MVLILQILMNRFTSYGYIQSVVRQEIKENIGSVLSKYYDVFASEDFVRGLSNL